ncbi:MAG: ATP-binding protein, partial [bacterium]
TVKRVVHPIIQDGSPLILNQPRRRGRSKKQAINLKNVSSFLGVPLKYHDAIGGVICLTQKKTPYSDFDIEIVERLASVFCEALIRVRIEEEVKTLNEELEDRVRKRTAQLLAANQELEAFSYSVSHDLRTPLRSIDGFSLAILEEYSEQLDSVGREYLQRVRTSAQYMANLIDNLLNLSRVSRREIVWEEVDLSFLVEEIVTELRSMEAQRQVTIQIQPNLSVNGDRNLLRVLLENLLGNAWKFSGKRDQGNIEFGSTGSDDQQVFYIKDNGVGFEMEYSDKLFGAFQRLHSVDEFPGTGIGLATVQRIVNLHGGRVWAESTPDQGATFYFSIMRGAHHEQEINPPGGR